MFVSSQVVFSPVVSTQAGLFSGRLLFGHLSPMVQGVVAVQSPRWWKSSLLSTPLQTTVLGVVAVQSNCPVL
ncbi:hypothetical protein F2Q70_00020057 [Brassica cretica]|uniref:Uncharacterized protein n=1 Tax=Brassica cretica TaxID=69181 RepID=A0A8S9GYV4_BRACR|nr:hypothetical protein F2Q70_00020057 [Brassica cretica]KAF3587558.1 hypothetical protein F2Q69_00026909 [Brassica cretica]